MMTTEEKYLRMMTAGKKTKPVGMPVEADMNVRIDRVRIPSEDGGLRWQYKRTPQFGLSNRSKKIGRIEKVINNWGELEYREYDTKGKLLGKAQITETPSRKKD